MKSTRRLISLFCIFFILPALACNLSANSQATNPSSPQVTQTSTPASLVTATSTNPQPNEPPTDIPTPAVQTEPPGATEAAAASPTSPPPVQATATPSPLCITLQNLNVRNGPGTAYEPPLTALETGTRLVPFGFNLTGIPDGSWVLISPENGNFSGWVNSGAQYISCNIDLTTLPSVQVAPPPPTVTPTPTLTPTVRPSAPQVSNGVPGGTCPENLTCGITFTPQTLAWVTAHFTNTTTDGEGVDYVYFAVKDQSESVIYYETTETNPAYCTFGGDGPCNGWIYENNAFRWYRNGDPILSGNYKLIIIIQGTTPDQFGNNQAFWQVDFTVTVP
jgi:hypothetical protein